MFLEYMCVGYKLLYNQDRKVKFRYVQLLKKILT